METINDILYFLNKVYFAGFLKSDDYQKIRCVKK